MNATLKIAAVAVLALAVGVGVVLLRPSTNSVTSGPSPSASPSPSQSPIALPEGDFEAGTTYFISRVGGFGSPRLIFTVPAMGWSGGGSNLRKGALTAPNNSVTVALTPWNVGNLYADPCHWRSGGLLDPPVGPTVDDLATALVRQAGVTPSTVSDVTLGGYPGKKVELSLPAGLDVATCDKFGDGSDAGVGIYARWEESGFPGGHNFGNGQRNTVYILDLDGLRAVIDTLSMPIASEADLAELEQLVASIRFEWPAVRTPSPSPSS
jgi:hypothetical protein